MVTPAATTHNTALQRLTAAAILVGAFALAARHSIPLLGLLRGSAWHHILVSGQSQWSHPDRAFLSMAAKGNVALVCLGLEQPLHPDGESLLAGYYFRGNYTMYPRRIYAAPPGTIINEAKDFTGTGWAPDPEFVRQHQIRTLVVASREPNGEIRLQDYPIAESVPARPTTRAAVPQ